MHRKNIEKILLVGVQTKPKQVFSSFNIFSTFPLLFPTITIKYITLKIVKSKHKGKKSHILSKNKNRNHKIKQNFVKI